jgi:hypothetical protein
MADPVVTITAARVDTGEGRAAAMLALIQVGGGTQVVTVDGTPEDREHPASQTWHVRLLSLDPMLPDRLETADSYEAAVEVATGYAVKLGAVVAQAAALAGP